MAQQQQLQQQLEQQGRQELAQAVGQTGGGGTGGDGGNRGDTACDSAYPDVCIPPPPPDLNCDDIDATNFTVLSPDSTDLMAMIMMV